MSDQTQTTSTTPDGAASLLTDVLGVTFRSHFEEWCRQVITEKDGGIDAQLHTVALSAFTAAYRLGFLAAVDMVRDKDDRYGIGNMCSMWRAEDVAEDLLQRAGLTP